jgi:Ca2+-binding RTX toxin-like protein
VPGCPNGGLLSGTEKADDLGGKDGDNEIHGLGGVDWLIVGLGNDVIYGGDGNDWWLAGGAGEDVLYGGNGNDSLDGDGESLGPGPPMRDELYCGPGIDHYVADKLHYVDSSCEMKEKPLSGGGIA